MLRSLRDVVRTVDCWSRRFSGPCSQVFNATSRGSIRKDADFSVVGRTRVVARMESESQIVWNVGLVNMELHLCR